MPTPRSPVPEFVLTLSCPDRTGLAYAVTHWLYERDFNILDSDQFGDAYSDRFFMRVHFAGERDLDEQRASFRAVADAHDMSWAIWPVANPLRVLILASRLDHCLNDLLYRTRNGELPIDIDLIASNHRDVYPLAAAADIDFLHLPVTPETKAAQEQRLLAEIDARGIHLVVLARYMQILTRPFCEALPGRIINIHHSFLPSFKGARPYHQAYEHGVKLIGATAHYVTADLDEGPIIEQSVERVDHRTSPEDLVAVGRDIERVVLARAVRYHAEHRVLLNGQRTVVFR
ncbi:MAG: formyltetrahydrofolate deformylase [Pseudomonadales bacterium]